MAAPTAKPAGRRPIGLFRWLTGGRHGFEAYLYLAHRLSGLALLGFLCAHIFVTSSRLFGEAVWERVMALTHNPVVQLLEYLVFVAFVFHAVNGVRLLLIETGLAVGRPHRPVYPYRSSLHTQRRLMIGAMVVTAVLIVLGGFEMLRFP